LGAKTSKKNNFPYPIFLLDFVWQLIVKDCFLGGLAIFLGGFWPSK
jgi:hypothetical protein